MRAFLIVSVLVWLPYGLLCLLRPDSLVDGAGVAAASTTGSVELRAMYGGLQAAIGVMALVALFRPELQQPYLLMVAFLCAGLGLARLFGAAVDGDFSAYTGLALLFEAVCVGVALWLLRRPEPAQA